MTPLQSAVLSLILNLIYAFYNGILGLTTGSLIFIVSAVYYLLLSAMRFSAVTVRVPRKERLATGAIGLMLIALSVVLHIMVLVSLKFQTAAPRGTVVMITIATFTFGKIGAAVSTGIRNRKNPSPLLQALNAIRYAQVAVSLLTMQQSMLVSFGDGQMGSALILNACTGAGVCVFILMLGILTFQSSRKEEATWQNPS